MAAYYNEFSPEPAHMLRKLIKDGLIAPGDVDERSIVDVRADDLKGYTQCHFFAGIGGWSVALRMAEWDDARPVWTGSCPCQPFSTAGKKEGHNDERHLWPHWSRLIRESKPATVFGEQVVGAIAYGWLDEVFNDLETASYSCAAAVLPACSVGKPHKRDRLWFVANSGMCDDGGASGRHAGKSREERIPEWNQDGFFGKSGIAMGDTQHDGSSSRPFARSQRQAISNHTQGQNSASEFAGASESLDVANSECWGRQGQGALEEPVYSEAGERRQANQPQYDSAGLQWVNCPDGKSRPVKSGIRLLAYGLQHQTPILHAFGNAIVPSVAAEFIKATM